MIFAVEHDKVSSVSALKVETKCPNVHVALAQFVEKVVSQFEVWFGGSIPSYSMSTCPQVQDAEPEVAPPRWSVCV